MADERKKMSFEDLIDSIFTAYTNTDSFEQANPNSKTELDSQLQKLENVLYILTNLPSSSGMEYGGGYYLDLAVFSMVAQRFHVVKYVWNRVNPCPWEIIQIPLQASIERLNKFQALIKLESRLLERKLNEDIFYIDSPYYVNNNSHVDYALDRVSKLTSDFNEIYNSQRTRNKLVSAFSLLRQQLQDRPPGADTKVFEHLKDLNSLTKIKTCAELPSLISKNQTFSYSVHELPTYYPSPSYINTFPLCLYRKEEEIAKYVAHRAVQIMGEYLKGTAVTKNLSKRNQDRLVQSYQVPLLALTTLRDRLCHINSIVIRQRRKLEWHEKGTRELQNSLQRARWAIAALHSTAELDYIKYLAEHIRIDFGNINHRDDAMKILNELEHGVDERADQIWELKSYLKYRDWSKTATVLLARVNPTGKIPKVEDLINLLGETPVSESQKCNIQVLHKYKFEQIASGSSGWKKSFAAMITAEELENLYEALMETLFVDLMSKEKFDNIKSSCHSDDDLKQSLREALEPCSHLEALLDLLFFFENLRKTRLSRIRLEDLLRNAKAYEARGARTLFVRKCAEFIPWITDSSEVQNRLTYFSKRYEWEYLKNYLNTIPDKYRHVMSTLWGYVNHHINTFEYFLENLPQSVDPERKGEHIRLIKEALDELRDGENHQKEIEKLFKDIIGKMDSVEIADKFGQTVEDYSSCCKKIISMISKLPLSEHDKIWDPEIKSSQREMKTDKHKGANEHQTGEGNNITKEGGRKANFKQAEENPTKNVQKSDSRNNVNNINAENNDHNSIPNMSADNEQPRCSHIAEAEEFVNNEPATTGQPPLGSKDEAKESEVLRDRTQDEVKSEIQKKVMHVEANSNNKKCRAKRKGIPEEEKEIPKESGHTNYVINLKNIGTEEWAKIREAMRRAGKIESKAFTNAMRMYEEHPYNKYLNAERTKKTFKDRVVAFKDFIKYLNINDSSTQDALVESYRQKEIDGLKEQFSERAETLSKLLPKGLEKDLLAQQEILHSKDFLEALSFLLLDLLDILKTLGSLVENNNFENLVTDPEYLAENFETNSTQNLTLVFQTITSLRNYLAHTDSLIEALFPDLNKSVILKTAQIFAEDYKAILGLVDLFQNSELTSHVQNLKKEDKISSLTWKSLPEGTKDEKSARLINAIQSTTRWQKYLNRLSIPGGSTPSFKDTQDVEKDKIFQYFTAALSDDLYVAMKYKQRVHEFQNIPPEVYSTKNTINNWIPMQSAAYFNSDLPIMGQQTLHFYVKDTLSRHVLHLSAVNSSTRIGKMFLELKHPVNEGDSYFMTALHYASLHGNLKFIQILLNHEADVNAQISRPRDNNELSWAPLHVACAKGHLEAVAVLLKNGANVNALGPFGNSPLHLSALRGNTEIVAFLLTHPDIQMTFTRDGRNPFHLAVERGHFDTVTEFLTYDPTLINCSTAEWRDSTKMVRPVMTPAQLAEGHYHYELEKYLLEFGLRSKLESDEGKDNALLVAASSLDLSNIKKLLAAGANPNAKGDNGRSPLQIVAESQKQRQHGTVVAILTELLSGGADPNQADDEGQTAVFAAIKGRLDVPEVKIKERLAAVKILTEYRADLTCKDNKGRRPVHIAATRSIDILIYLVTEKGICPTEIDDEGSTPLHLAAECRYLQDSEEIITYLVAECPTLLNSLNKKGKTPLHSCLSTFNKYQNQNDQERAVKYLLDLQPDVFAPSPEDSLIHELLQTNCTCDAVLRLILEAMKPDPRGLAYVNAFDKNGRSPLMKACELGLADFAKILVRYGGDLNQVTGNGQNALSFAASVLDSTTMQFLLDNSKDISIVDGTDNMIHQSILNCDKQVLSTILIFLENNYPTKFSEWINYRSNRGNTPLAWAAGHAKGSAIHTQILIDYGAEVDKANLTKNESPLHLASKYGEIEIMKVLLSGNACVTTQNNDGKTPFDIWLIFKSTTKKNIDAKVLDEIDLLFNGGHGPV